MTFNKNQKIATIIYCLFIIVIPLFLTPYFFIRYSGGFDNYHTEIRFGNFFSLTDSIAYPKFFIEIAIVTVIYSLSLILLKSKDQAGV